MANRTPLFSRQQPGGLFAVSDLPDHPGNIWFVGSDVSGASDTAGYGQDPDSPVATLDYAIGLCTANNGDVIYVLPSHSETYSTTGAKVTLDVAGVRVIGLGDGADRPTFTFGHTGATWTWSAAAVTIENILFVTSVDSVTTFASISGADATIRNCETRDTTDVEVITDFTCTGDRLVVDGLFKNGYTSGDANVRVLSLNGVDRAEIKNCRFITKVTTAIVGMVSNASTAVEVHDCDFLVDSTTDFSKNVVDGVGTSTWAVWNVFDLGAGGSFSGGSGATVATDDLTTVSSLLTSSATSVGTAQRSTTASSATSVGTAQISTTSSSAGSVITNVDSTAASSATSVGTAQISTTASSATSVITDLQSTAGSVITNVDSTTASSTLSVVTDLYSAWTSWDTAWTVYYSYLRSDIDST